MGIFKKILQKKERGAENPPPKTATPKKKAVSPKPDPLAPLGIEDPSPTPVPATRLAPPDSANDHAGAGRPVPVRDLSQIDRTPIRETAYSEQDVPETEPESAQTALSPVPRKVREAEQGLASLQKILAEVAPLFKGTENLPKLKILLVEAKIKLAEADIKLSEAEMIPAGSSHYGEIEDRISQAEAKIVEAEKVLSSMAVPASGKGNYSRLKIGVAGIKIRLAEIQIALAGSDWGEAGMERIPEPETARETPVAFLPNAPVAPEERDIRLGVPEPEPPQDTEIHKEIRIRQDDPEMGVPSLPRSEPVHIRETEDPDTDSIAQPADPGERITLPDMEGESSPFETGINLNRVQIRTEDAVQSGEPQGAQERVKIRSDERESAWVTENGSLKIVSREKAPSEPARDDERPRISIQHPEVETALVIEELNRKGIDERRRGEINGALESFERVLELDPSNVAALHNKGVVLRTVGKYEEALACFDRAQERDPDNPVILFNRGFCLGKLERYEEALKAFDRVLALKSDHASGWYNKGKILQKMGRIEEAEEHLKKAQELGYR